ncbi:PcfJ domain-containing protein [Lachnotalea glycerini]|uniref:PcfJ-like protein n=1 Tax=Lachnotalea glycerini TaxID=1763509 RepID=A0A371JC41_9FIRM|nr:PcfJ domain-containing protein [Lachnotalea glycerini]RDY30312.1 hypothetical protein CG710_015375 [Lachnotalea glycerini]
MKKSSLLQIPVTALSSETDFQSTSKETWLLIEAQCVTIEGNKVLALDIYEKDKSLLCRHFVSEEAGAYFTIFKKKTDFLYQKTYRKDQWSTQQYETILNRGDTYFCCSGNKAQYSKKADKAIKNFKKKKLYINQSSTYAITEIERDIASEKRLQAKERKAERIARLMEQVTPLDSPFYDWIKEKVVPNRYIFAETRPLKRGYRCRCVACGNTYFSKEKPKHNTAMECKKCYMVALVKTRVNCITEKKNILVAQPYDETTWVVRHFRLDVHQYIAFKKPVMTLLVYERVRMFLSPNKQAKIYYGIYCNADETKQTWGTQKGGILIDKSFMMYPNRIAEITTKQAKINMIRTLQYASNQNIEMDYNELIRRWEYMPYIEYLIKGRYFRLANEVFTWGNRDYIDINAEHLNNLLKLDFQRASRLREIDGGIEALKLLQEEKESGKKVSQDNLLFVNENKVNIELLEQEQTKLSSNQALNYAKRQLEKNKMAVSTFLTYYKDYLSMAAEQGMDLTDDIVRRNPRMIEFHNRYLEEKNREADEKRKTSMRKKFSNIEKDYVSNCKRFAWENDDYQIMVPRNAGEIIEEGRQQHHCVGASDIYMDRMNRGESYILFLRRKESPNLPYYTLEVKKDKILQKYAAYDRQPDIKEVNKVLAEWSLEVKKREKKTKVQVMTQQPSQPVRLLVAAGQ